MSIWPAGVILLGLICLVLGSAWRVSRMIRRARFVQVMEIRKMVYQRKNNLLRASLASCALDDLARDLFALANDIREGRA